MKPFFRGLVLLFALADCSLAQTPGEVRGDNGVDIDKVQAPAKKAAAALAKDQAAVLLQINRGDKTLEGGDFYVVVLQGIKILAHGYLPTMVGPDMSTLPYYNELATAVEHMVVGKREGCVRYKAPKPSQRGQLHDKASYVIHRTAPCGFWSAGIWFERNREAPGPSLTTGSPFASTRLVSIIRLEQKPARASGPPFSLPAASPGYIVLS